MSRAVDFAQTGNIEITRNGKRILVGQCADGRFLIREEFKTDAHAQARIEVCRMIAESYGIQPEIVYQ